MSETERVKGWDGEWDERWDNDEGAPPSGVRFRVIREEWVTEGRDVPLRVIQEVELISN